MANETRRTGESSILPRSGQSLDGAGGRVEPFADLNRNWETPVRLVSPLRAIAAVLFLLGAGSLHAQTWPAKPIRVLIPFVAGGPSDTVGRAIASKFQEYLGQPGVVENRAGANGAIAGEALAKADPDGYTVMVGSIGVFAINAALMPALRYDPVRDFAPVTLAVTTPNVLVTRTGLPVASTRDFVEHAKRNGRALSYCSSGTGSSDHLTGELFKQISGTDGVHVPYKGGAACTTDLIGGQIDYSFQNLGTVATQIRAGKLRALAVTAKSRNPQIPETPTLAEGGYPDLIVTSWQAMAAPAKTPPEILARLHDAAARALRSPEIRERLTNIGFDVVATAPEEFGEFLRAEIVRWRQVIQRGNIKPD